ncbi:MAG: septum formation protein Maf [Chloroflexi bacterium]|nr:septum formation protein Maf [Chloroflexota bacterium]
MGTTLILASSSPRRRELLASLGIDFTIIKPQVDESQRPGEPPLDYVARLSREKAADVAARLDKPAAVLAADTVVILGADTLGVDERGDILGKPADADDARDMLRRLRGRTHRVCTALTLIQVDGVGARYIVSLQPPQSLTRVTCTDVTMRDYSDAEIEAYIATGDPFDKAGSYAIQHPEFNPVARIDGSYTNVVGLPLETLRAMLAEIGWPVRQAADEASKQ